MAIGRKIYEDVTLKMIEALEEGFVPWRRPWDSQSSMPVNIVTERTYRGIVDFLREEHKKADKPL